MDISIPIVLTILTIHFFADFVSQSHWMAINKSKSNRALLCHVTVYTFCLITFPWKFWVFNGLAHFVTDYFTSRINAHLWAKNRVHDFFVGVGFDQLVHSYTLILSWYLFCS